MRQKVSELTYRPGSLLNKDTYNHLLQKRSTKNIYQVTRKFTIKSLLLKIMKDS